MLLHSSLPLGEQHTAHNWEYADSIARLAATGFLPSDAHKIALQLDTHSLWILSSVSPITWVAVGVVGMGDVVGPVSSTNNHIALFDLATGKLIKDSGVLVTDLIPKSTITAKGSLITSTAAATPVELLIGPDGTSPVADSADPSGIRWQNTQTTGATPAMVLYPNTTVFQAINTESAYEIDQMDPTPALGTETVDAIAVTAINSPKLDEIFLRDVALGVSSTIPTGIFEFHSFCSVDSVGGGRVSSIRNNMYLVEVGTGTLTTTGTGTSRAATITGGTPFVAGDYNASSLLTSFIRTPTGIHLINGYTSTSVVSIDALSTYTNEAGVAYTIYRYTFGGISPTITSIGTDYQPVVTTVAIGTPIALSATTKLAYAIFGISNNTTTVNFVHNGTAHYSHIHTTLIGSHNDLPGLNVGDYKHLTATEYANLSAGKATGAEVNTGTNDTKHLTPKSIADSTVMSPLNTSISVTGLTGGAATITLTAAQNKSTSLEVTGVASTNIVIITANTMPPFVAENLITVGSGFTVMFKTAAGTGIVIPDAVKAILYANGTNVESMTGGAGTGDMILAAIQTVTAAKTFADATLKLGGATSGAATLKAPAVAATNTYTLPPTQDTLAGVGQVQSFTKTQIVTPVALSIAANAVAVNLALSNNFSLALQATTGQTLSNPTNAVDGTSGQIAITQNATPSTLAFGANWISSDGTTPAMSTTASAVNLLTYYVVDSTHIWFALNKHGVA
jgi:hypothetical protein